MIHKIKETYGCTIQYNDETQRFILRHADGTELAHKVSQEECEDYAKKLSKVKFERIPFYRVRGHFVDTGVVTSVDVDDTSLWLKMDEKTGFGSGRQKQGLRFGTDLYKQTPHNKEVVQQIGEKRLRIVGIESEIEALTKSLDEPINRAMFGMKQ